MQNVFGWDEFPNALERRETFLDESEVILAKDADEGLAGEHVEDEEKHESQTNARGQHQLDQRTRL